MPKFANVCLSERSYPILCNPGELDLRVCDFVILGMGDGVEETGFIRSMEYRCEHQMKGRELPAILRKAVPREVRAWHFLKRREAEAMAACKQKAAEHKLEMKVSSVHFDDRQRKICFNFTADKRVDFRDLVRDLAALFHARIELWQIGVRDEARKMCGVGVCGCQLCCSAWLKDFAPVSIRYAKTQDIQFSPTKLSGVCGRLRCCLAYEQEQYVAMGKDAPPIGSIVQTINHGEVKVVDRNLLSRTVTIYDNQGQTHTIPFSGIKGMKAAGDAENEEDIVLDPGDTPEEATAMLEGDPAVKSGMAKVRPARPGRPERGGRDRRERNDSPRHPARPAEEGDTHRSALHAEMREASRRAEEVEAHSGEVQADSSEEDRFHFSNASARFDESDSSDYAERRTMSSESIGEGSDAASGEKKDDATKPRSRRRGRRGGRGRGRGDRPAGEGAEKSAAPVDRGGLSERPERDRRGRGDSRGNGPSRQSSGGRSEAAPKAEGERRAGEGGRNRGRRRDGRRPPNSNGNSGRPPAGEAPAAK